MKQNFILMTDSYKLTHWKQYPEGTTKVYSYLESRGGKFDKTVFFGLQYYIKEYLQGSVLQEWMIDEAKGFCKLHFGTDDYFNEAGWRYILTKYEGRLPIKIKAVKEGSLVPTHNVLMTIENTDPECAWLTNTVETLLMKLWYTCTVATNSYYIKQIIKRYLNATGGSIDGLAWKLHDFGYRGASSEEQAGLGGMSHLINFRGTDTIKGIAYANEYYNSGICGNSVPASEHSVACSFGKDNEEGYFLNMLKQYPTGIVSIVSDSYDIYNFITTMSSKYKQEIINRNGAVVFRPDSGDPIEVNMRLIDILWTTFGGTYVNGYKLLIPQVRLIQGDGIDLQMVENILAAAKAKGYCADNWVFGSGGGLLQKFDRDTQNFAIKASYGERIVNNKTEVFDLIKTPVTSKTKRSKAGKLKLQKSNDNYITISSANETDVQFNSYVDCMDVVFENGMLLRTQYFNEIQNILDNEK